MNGEVFDIYQDLENFYLGQPGIQELDNKTLQNKYEVSLEKITNLETENADLKKKLKNIEKSFYSLLSTAKLEIKRKDRQIDELRQELENIKFRRYNHKNSNNFANKGNSVKDFQNGIGISAENPSQFVAAETKISNKKCTSFKSKDEQSSKIPSGLNGRKSVPGETNNILSKKKFSKSDRPEIFKTRTKLDEAKLELEDDIAKFKNKFGDTEKEDIMCKSIQKPTNFQDILFDEMLEENLIEELATERDPETDTHCSSFYKSNFERSDSISRKDENMENIKILHKFEKSENQESCDKKPLKESSYIQKYELNENKENINKTKEEIKQNADQVNVNYNTEFGVKLENFENNSTCSGIESILTSDKDNIFLNNENQEEFLNQQIGSNMNMRLKCTITKNNMKIIEAAVLSRKNLQEIICDSKFSGNETQTLPAGRNIPQNYPKCGSQLISSQLEETNILILNNNFKQIFSMDQSKHISNNKNNTSGKINIIENVQIAPPILNSDFYKAEKNLDSVVYDQKFKETNNKIILPSVEKSLKINKVATDELIEILGDTIETTKSSHVEILSKKSCEEQKNRKSLSPSQIDSNKMSDINNFNETSNRHVLTSQIETLEATKFLTENLLLDTSSPLKSKIKELFGTESPTQENRKYIKKNCTPLKNDIISEDSSSSISKTKKTDNTLQENEKEIVEYQKIITPPKNRPKQNENNKPKLKEKIIEKELKNDNTEFGDYSKFLLENFDSGDADILKTENLIQNNSEFQAIKTDLLKVKNDLTLDLSHSNFEDGKEKLNAVQEQIEEIFGKSPFYNCDGQTAFNSMCTQNIENEFIDSFSNKTSNQSCELTDKSTKLFSKLGKTYELKVEDDGTPLWNITKKNKRKSTNLNFTNSCNKSKRLKINSINKSVEGDVVQKNYKENKNIEETQKSFANSDQKEQLSQIETTNNSITGTEIFLNNYKIPKIKKYQNSSIIQTSIIDTRNDNLKSNTTVKNHKEKTFNLPNENISSENCKLSCKKENICLLGDKLEFPDNQLLNENIQSTANKLTQKEYTEKEHLELNENSIKSSNDENLNKSSFFETSTKTYEMKCDDTNGVVTWIIKRKKKKKKGKTK